MTDTIFRIGGLTVRQDQWKEWYRNKTEDMEETEKIWKNGESMLSVVQQVSTARFVCPVDYLGMDIRELFWKDGVLDVNKEGIQEDIRTASDMLYNSTHYIIME